MLVVPVGTLHTLELRLMVGVADDDVLLVFVGETSVDVLDNVGARSIICGVSTKNGVDELGDATPDVRLLALLDGLERALARRVEVSVIEATDIPLVQTNGVPGVEWDSLPTAVVAANADTRSVAQGGETVDLAHVGRSATHDGLDGFLDGARLGIGVRNVNRAWKQ